MRNAVLHLVSNQSGFNIPFLPEVSSYVPYTTTPAEDRIRSLLHINTSAYHLISSLISVYSFSEILAEFNETIRTFDFHNLLPTELHITGATYANTESENFNILPKPVSFPSPSYYNWTVQYADEDSLLLIACDSRFVVPYALSTVVEDSETYRVLSGEWPAVTGIKGGFALDDTTAWVPGGSFTLIVPPISFPYDKAVAVVSRLSELPGVLNKAGLARNFYNARSDIEKYALIMLALARPASRGN